MIAQRGRAESVLFVDAKCDLGVGVDYPAPETIGADRLANAVAVNELYGRPAIVVDFGTAVTFDVVSAAGDYVGGVIAPGLESMTTFSLSSDGVAAETECCASRRARSARRRARR